MRHWLVTHSVHRGCSLVLLRWLKALKVPWVRVRTRTNGRRVSNCDLTIRIVTYRSKSIRWPGKMDERSCRGVQMAINGKNCEEIKVVIVNVTYMLRRDQSDSIKWGVYGRCSSWLRLADSFPPLYVGHINDYQLDFTCTLRHCGKCLVLPTAKNKMEDWYSPSSVLLHHFHVELDTLLTPSLKRLKSNRNLWNRNELFLH